MESYYTVRMFDHLSDDSEKKFVTFKVSAYLLHISLICPCWILVFMKHFFYE